MLVENIQIPEVPIPRRIALANTKRRAALKRAKTQRTADQKKRQLNRWRA